MEVKLSKIEWDLKPKKKQIKKKNKMDKVV